MSDRNSHQRLCGTCNYPLSGLDMSRCPECGAEFDLADDATFNATGCPINWISRTLLAAPAWPVIVLGLVLLVQRLWELRPPEWAMRATWYDGWYFTCAVVVGVRVIQLLLRRMVETQFGRKSYLKRHRSRWPAWPFLLVLVLTTSWMAENRWPMRWAFAYSRPSFDDLATKSLANAASVGTLVPAKAGVFNACSVVVLDDQTVILYTRYSSAGGWGFARMPQCAEDIRDLDAEHGLERYRFQRALRIAGDWFVVYDSYWAVKDGWS